MIVVADTSPLNYLILIDEVNLLHLLFGTILIPRVVLQELKHPRASIKVRSWAESLPGWLEIRDGAVVVHRALVELDPGEREAIQKALDLKAEVVLIDDLEGRMLAGKLGLEVRGTLGILERGARLGLCGFRQSLARLERTTFQMHPELVLTFSGEILSVPRFIA